MDPYCLKKLNAERQARRAALLLTDLGDGRDRVIKEGDPVAGLLGDAVRQAFLSGKSGLAEIEGRSFFLNVHVPPPRLVVIGAVHISQALAPVAKIAGYDMEIIDPRTAFATPDRFPDIKLFAEWPQDILEKRPLDPYTAVAVVTHDPKIDDQALERALKAGCFYVGALGSRKTHAKRVERLTALGFNQDEIALIHSPIGLDIGASSPAEIAVAVMAEVIKAFRARGLQTTRHLEKDSMIFGEIPLEDALGAILAHSTHTGDLKLKKGHVLTADDIGQLREAGVTHVIAARLQDADLEENEAAKRITAALRWSGVRAGPASTGRVNCYAETAGLFTVDADLINAINAVDPSVTIATLKAFDRVEQQQMVATIKIIPFAVPVSVVDRIAELARGRTAFGVRSFAGSRIGLIQTTLPSIKQTVLDKTRRVIEARIAANHGVVTSELRPPHASKPLAEAMRKLQKANDFVVVFGASAVVDQDDIVPAAIREAGGAVSHIGMPVDPGNLLILGELDQKPLIGAPGCARSPKENGFDWVLDRLMANVPVTKADIVGMGVGGLLMEIPTRPQPRDPRPLAARPDVAIALLAAGQSTRMMGPNKLLATFDDVPLIRRSAQTAIEAGGRPVVAVLGHMAEQCSAALDGLNVMVALNKDYASGLASSLQTAIRNVPGSSDGVMMLLADMPALSATDLQAMISRFQSAGGQSVVRATFEGKRGNPVILPRILFNEVFSLAGDVGARHLIERGDIPVIDVELGEAAALDVDTPDMLHRAGGTITEPIR